MARKRNIIRLSQFIYFGRLDFTTPEQVTTPVYIGLPGLHSFVDER